MHPILCWLEYVAPSPISCARSFFWEKPPFDVGKQNKKIEKKKRKIVSQRPGPIFCRGGLRLAGL
jgi:uracil DNA glycosylase